MKLKNKRTGEIGELQVTEKHCAVAVGNGTASCGLEIYSSLAGLYEEWKDYEEQKKYYVINPVDWVEVIGEIEYRNDSTDKINKEIGNYFETKEEAEKAVEKLKAWKRLKDKGFRFTGIAGISNNIFVSFETDSKYSGGHIMYDEYSNTDNKLKEYNEDLTLLFGGEECN